MTHEDNERHFQHWLDKNSWRRDLERLEQVTLGWFHPGAPGDAFKSRSFGPKCKCHGERNMKRIGQLEYACLKTGQVFTLRELLWPR